MADRLARQVQDERYVYGASEAAVAQVDDAGRTAFGDLSDVETVVGRYQDSG